MPQGQTTLVVDEVTFLPVPEPSTAVLMGLGLAALPLRAGGPKRRFHARSLEDEGHA